MNKILIFIFLICFSNKLYTQVIITSAQNPKIGTTFVFANLNDDTSALAHFSFDTTGTNNIWNFSILPSNFKDTFWIVNPQYALGHDSFPNAHFASTQNYNRNYFRFAHSDSDALYSLGDYWSYPPYNSALSYVNYPPTKVLQFPYQYGSSFMSNSRFFTPKLSGLDLSVIADSSYIVHNIISLNQVIASGNMIIPSGTYPAILTKITTSSIDSIFIKDSTTNWQWLFSYAENSNWISGGYFWFTNNSTNPYAMISADGGTNYSIQYYMSQTPGVGIVELIHNKNILGIYPNPANNKLHIENMNERNTFFLISDISGRLLMKVNIQSEIDISELAQGIYFISVFNDNELVGRSKFVKQ